MRLIRLAILLFIIVIAQSAGADVQWRVTRTKHFIIYYSAGAESVAQKSGTLAEKWHGILSQKMKFTPGGVTPIYLYPDRPSFSEATGVGLRERIVGIAHTRTLVIRVDASGAYTDAATVIPHELVHVFISRRLGEFSARMPLWVHEGLAKYLAQDWSLDDAELLADAVSGGETLPLDKLVKTFPADERKRSIAYVQSRSAVEYIAKTYGGDSIPDLLDEFARGRLYPQALFNSIGVEPRKFEDQWQQSLWEKYKLGRWIKLGTAGVSAVMAFLAVLAFRARIHQKRRKAQEMEDESRIEE